MKIEAIPSLIKCLLIILYLLQGVIIGFSTAIPLYLDSYGAKWKEQGAFSFVYYPFSLKLAWAPLIDALYIKRFGRRKTWLVPIEYLMGSILFILSFYLTKLMEELKIKILTFIFFFIYFLLASHDVSVDGWALTLLANYNLQWAPTCQTIGQTTGRFIGFTVLMTFESANFTNRFLRTPFSIEEKSYGLFTIDRFLRCWGIAYIVLATIIGLLIKEKQEDDHLNLKQSYLSIFELLKKKCIRQLVILTLVSPIGYAATYSMTTLVLKKYGVPQEILGLLGVALIIVKIVVPLFMANTNRPLTWFRRSYLPRLFICILIAIYVSFTPSILSQWFFYPILICLFLINESIIYLMTVSRLGFYARISDRCIGGTYITFLGMCGNIGFSSTISIVLFSAGKIKPDYIAYYVLVGVSVILGCLWFILQYRTMKQLEELPIEKWHLQPIKTTELENIDEDTRETCLNENEREK